jgi:hypothetical protein
MAYRCICGWVADDRQLFLTHLELDSYDHAEDYPDADYDGFEEWHQEYEDKDDPVINMEAAFDAGYALGWDDAETYFR